MVLRLLCFNNLGYRGLMGNYIHASYIWVQRVSANAFAEETQI